LRSAIVLCVSSLTLVACGGAPPPRPLRVPDVESETLHFAGSLLTGPTPGSVDPAAVTPTTAYAVHCRLVYVEDLPEAALEPIEARSLLALDTRDADPLLGYAPLSHGARVGADAAAERFLENYVDGGLRRTIPLEDLQGISAAGVTAAFVIRSLDTAMDPVEGPTRPSLTVLVSRSPSAVEQVQVALLVQRFRGAPDDESGLPGQAVSRQMVLLEDRPNVSGSPLVLSIPSPFVGDANNGFVLAVSVDPPSASTEHEELVSAVASHLTETTVEAARRARASRLVGPDLRAIQRGISSLIFAQNQRPAMIFLAAAADGSLSLDLALSGDDLLLAEWIERLQAQLEATEQAADPDEGADLDWQFERSAWLTTVARASSGELDAAITGMLLRHAGEAARYPDLLGDVVASARSHEDLESRLVKQNREFLTDNDVAARTRAHDWLAERGQAIDGYEPLAPRSERRAALRAAEQAAAEAAAGTEGGTGS
jgi:hypothetical protein